MASEQVQPLRVTKLSNFSPSKMPSPAGSRPLAELNPLGVRRNSGGFKAQNQSPKQSPSVESSPFDPSPGSNSKLQFWKERENLTPSRVGNENMPFRESQPSPTRRNSLERLMKVSRVTANNFFVREDEQTRDAQKNEPLPNINRPMGIRHEPASFNKNFSPEGSQSPQRLSWTQQKLQGETRIPWLSPNRMPAWSPPKSNSPPRERGPMHRSSISTHVRNAALADLAAHTPQTPDIESDSDGKGHASTPRPFVRQAKSVSFDVAPPQINEYEMITPDPSSVASDSREGSVEADFYEEDEAYEDGRSYGDDDSFAESLENTDKTPVVLPEDWRFMNPEAANNDLVATFEDPFDDSLAERERQEQGSRMSGRHNTLTRSDSVMSNGERRPLPPLPGTGASTAAAGSVRSSPARDNSPSRRHLQLAPYVTSCSREGSPEPFERKFESLSLKAESTSKKGFETEHESSSDSNKSQKLAQLSKPDEIKESGTVKGRGIVHEYQPPSLISRESILRQVENKSYSLSSLYSGEGYADDEYEYQYGDLDPDVPIPSREATGVLDDASLIADSKNREARQSKQDDFELDFGIKTGKSPSPGRSEKEHCVDRDGVDASNSLLSLPSLAAAIRERPSEESLSEKVQHDIRRESISRTTFSNTGSHGQSKSVASGLGISDFAAFMGKADFGLGPDLHLKPSQSRNEPDPEVAKSQSGRSPPSVSSDASTKQQDDGVRDLDYELQSQRSSTPESVIRYPQEDDEEEQDSPVIPEQIATIKASGMKLKTRPSATPADIRAMAAARREVSDEKPLPSLPGEDSEEDDDVSAGENVEGRNEQSEPIDSNNRVQSQDKNTSLRLNVPIEILSGDDGLGLDEAFDRVVEAQKRGYVMRQNTNFVIASNRQLSEDKSSLAGVQEETQTSPDRQSRPPKVGFRKPSGNTWRAEPWNGKVRRQSSRSSSSAPERRLNPTGQENGVTGLETLAEDQVAGQDKNDGGERGRVFVKVIKIKELDLPLPQDERCQFVLTLDNGLHCVTTNWLELGRTAPIGQEFELVVFDDLEFQLTLQTRLNRPESVASIESLNMHSSSASFRMPKVSKLSRLLASPKKRREREQREREEEEAALQRQYEQDAQRGNRRPTAWELQHQLVGEDGSFARAYVNLSSFEQQAFGRPHIIDIPCFNEWATEDKNFISTRSKMGGIQRRPPYRIGKLELQLLFIPKPRAVGDDEMPRSIAAAVRQLKEAEGVREQYFEGHLSQQGGDCPYWRRRFFKMQGPILTAYHDTTRQVRATISLARATQLIDDRSSLTKLDAPSSPSKGNGRRKSAFAQDGEGYMFVEEGFRVRFANGESIDFYADNTHEKEKWMRALSPVVGKDGAVTGKVTWMSAVLERERALARSGVKKHQIHEADVPPRGGLRSAPTSPRKHIAALYESGDNHRTLMPEGAGRPTRTPPPVPGSAKHSSMPNPPSLSKPFPNSGRMSPEQRTPGRRQAVRSMIF